MASVAAQNDRASLQSVARPLLLLVPLNGAISMVFILPAHKKTDAEQRSVAPLRIGLLLNELPGPSQAALPQVCRSTSSMVARKVLVQTKDFSTTAFIVGLLCEKARACWLSLALWVMDIPAYLLAVDDEIPRA
jgi:hypothetical protein